MSLIDRLPGRTKRRYAKTNERNRVIKPGIPLALALGTAGWLAVGDGCSAPDQSPSNDRDQNNTRQDDHGYRQQSDNGAPQGDANRQLVSDDASGVRISVDDSGKLITAGPNGSKVVLLDAISGQRTNDAPQHGSVNSVRTYVIYSSKSGCATETLNLRREADGSLTQWMWPLKDQPVMTRDIGEIPAESRSIIAECREGSFKPGESAAPSSGWATASASKPSASPSPTQLPMAL